MEFTLLKKIQKIILYIVLLYAVFGFFVLPYILKSQIVSGVSEQTKANISIEDIYFNPFTFGLKVSGIDLHVSEKQHLLSVQSLTLNLEVLSLLRSAIHVKRFVVQEPKISLIYNKDKTLNFTQIFKENNTSEDTQKTQPSKLPRIILDRVAIVDGVLKYEDYTHKSKFDFLFERIGFELQNIDTDDFNSSDSSLRFYSALGDGGFVDLKSKITGVAPLKMEGSLNFEASKLYTQWRYLQDSLKLEIADGKLSFYTDYSFNMDELNATKIENLTLYLEKLRIKPKDKYKDILNLKSFYLCNTTIMPMLQDVHIGTIALDALSVKVKRDTNHTIDWVEYLQSKESVQQSEQTQQKQASKSDSSHPWKVLVDDIALENIQVDFYDKGVSPEVDTRIDELNLYMQHLSLAGDEPFSYQLHTKINEDFLCDFQGSIKHHVLDLRSSVKCRGFDVVHYNPYIDEIARANLSTYNVLLENAVIGFDANVSVQEKEQMLVSKVVGANFEVEDFIVKQRDTQSDLLSFQSFNVSGIDLDTQTKNIEIHKILLDQLDVAIIKGKDTTLNVENLIVAKAKEAAQSTQKQQKMEPEQGYTIFLQQFALSESGIQFTDKTLLPPLTHKIEKFTINAYDINSSSNTWLRYDTRLRINGDGIITSKGKVRHTPLKYKGELNLQHLSLKALSPYVEKMAYVNVADGYLNMKNKIEYMPSQHKPDLLVNGSMNIQELFLNDTRDNTSLLSFSNLALTPFTLELFPNKLFINEVDLDSFYVNAIVYKDKQLNFASLMKQAKTTQEAKKDVEEEQPKEVFPAKIMKLNVHNGSAQFADLSLPLTFKTNIHDLNGAVYAISTIAGETSYVEIDGVVDQYGSTKLKGSLNASNPKEYTDINFNFKNLALNSFSGYSASFAGYKIDEGKLYLDLGYKILDSELLGENSIIIKNIKLGDEIEDENITKLPLGFVIALLEDSEGVIDIDMPVKGNVDEPDFKYGALVWKTLGNLVVKAVSSPFRFLASMMGMDGADLEYAEFEPGDKTILPPEREKLDSIAKMLLKRPKIALGVGGRYDTLSDTKALQKEKLMKKVLALSGAKDAKNYQSAMSVALLEKIYYDAKQDDKPLTIQKELSQKYKDETLQRAYKSALMKECTKIQPISKEELEGLAQQRSQAIQSYLINAKNIEPTRIKLLEVGVSDEENEKLVKNELKIEVK